MQPLRYPLLPIMYSCVSPNLIFNKQKQHDSFKMAPLTLLQQSNNSYSDSYKKPIRGTFRETVSDILVKVGANLGYLQLNEILLLIYINKILNYTYLSRVFLLSGLYKHCNYN